MRRPCARTRRRRGDPAVENRIARLEPVYAAAKHATPEEHDRAFDEALGFEHLDLAITDAQRERLDAARKERRPWEANIPLEVLRVQTFPKLVFRGDWSPAFGQVAETIATRIGAELVTMPGEHGAQHRPGFNERLLALWAQVEVAAI